MAKNDTSRQEVLVRDDMIINKIYYLRGHKVMLDSDLAELYGVETRRLKEQVRRNMTRFPGHFMFELTREEYNEILRSQNAILGHGTYSKYLPFVFSEHGVLMLSNVLKSERAITMSIRIIDIFVKLRETLANHAELKLEIEQVKNAITKQSQRQDNQDKNMELVFQYLDELNDKIDHPPLLPDRERVGYKIGESRGDKKE